MAGSGLLLSGETSFPVFKCHAPVHGVRWGASIFLDLSKCEERFFVVIQQYCVERCWITATRSGRDRWTSVYTAGHGFWLYALPDISVVQKFELLQPYPWSLKLAWEVLKYFELENMNREVHSGMQCSAIFQNLSDWCWKLGIQNLQHPRLSIMKMKLSSMMHLSRVFLQLLIPNALVIYSKIDMHGLGAGLRSSDCAHFMLLINGNKRAHGVHSVSQLGLLHGCHGQKWRTSKKDISVPVASLDLPEDSRASCPCWELRCSPSALCTMLTFRRLWKKKNINMDNPLLIQRISYFLTLPMN